MPKKSVIKKSSLAPTVLISGGSGFIGYYLTETFLEKGARVVILDENITSQNRRISKFVNNDKFALFEISPNGVLPTEIESVDYIIHIGDLEKYFVDKDDLDLDTLLINSQNIKSLLDLSAKSNAKFLLVSTINVYEDADPLKLSTSYINDNIVNSNIFKTTDARKFAEAVVWEHSRRFGTNVRVVRIPFVYGPEMNLDACGSLGEMLRDLLHRRDITIYGDENRKEHYLYIKDAISGIVKALFNPNTKGNTYTLVGEDSHKVLTTAFLLRTLADRRTEVLFKDSAKEYLKDIKISSQHNLVDLGWWPEYSIKEGILTTLERYGYHVNENTFKPKELILEKEKRKTGSIINLSEFTTENSLIGSFISDSVSTKPNIIQSNKGFTKLGFLLQKGLSKIKNIFDFSVVKKVFSDSPAIVLSIFAVVVAALIIFIFTPLFTFNSGIQQTYKSLQEAQEYLYKFDIANAQKSTADADIQLTRSRSSLVKARWIYKLILGSEGYSFLNNSLISLNYFIKASNDLTLSLDPYKNMWNVIHPDATETLNADEIAKSQTHIISANNEIQLAKANFSYVNKEKFPKRLVPYLDKYESYLNIVSDDLNLLSNSYSDISSLLGMEKPKTYIIWFQNSNELRPTGGFIGSYGILTIDKGKIIGLNIDDIYNPDGQIDVRNIRVPAPKLISTELAEDRLYLRNSNWSPDFSQSAKEFSDLYSRVTGVTPDGIIAVDLYFVKNILNAVGPLYLASYDEEINANNLYERAQYHSDFKYQDGVSDKKAFLTVLSGKLLETVFGLDKGKIQPIVTSLLTSLDEKHLMLTFNNNSTNLLLEKRNWNGNLISTDKDYLYIVNSNLGGTKANYYVKNKYEYKVTSQTRDGLLRGTLSLNYTHTGKDMSWPGGPYKNYVRVLVQKGSKLTGATISYGDKTPVSIFDKFVVSTVGTFDSFEYLFTLNPMDKAIITINYDLPTGLSLSKSFKDYGLLWQKQPGTQDDEVSFEFTPPFGMEISDFNTNIKQNEKVTNSTFSDILNINKKFNIIMR